MKSITAKDVLAGDCPEGELYVFRVGDCVLYVGKTTCMETRLWEHITGQPRGNMALGRLFGFYSDGFKARVTIDIYTAAEVLGKTDAYHVQSWHTDKAETILINRLRPCLNAAKNEHQRELPRALFWQFLDWEREELHRAAVRAGVW